MAEQSADRLEELTDGSIIQHGPYNDRIYLMKAGGSAPESLAAELLAMARQYGYAKIFAKIPAEQAAPFVRLGYVEEAVIPGFYGGCRAGIFLGYYLNEVRACEADAGAVEEIRQMAIDKAATVSGTLDDRLFTLRQCRETDVTRMAVIYSDVFPTYPFPIGEPEYLLNSMRSDVAYFGVERAGELVALASAEMDLTAQNAEMTDFATLPRWRGNSLGIHLLLMMEKEAARRGIKTAYTIARAMSPGMNIVFARLGYKYGGRLKNNTNISGRIESMNIWHKILG